MSRKHAILLSSHPLTAVDGARDKRQPEALVSECTTPMKASMEAFEAMLNKSLLKLSLKPQKPQLRRTSTRVILWLSCGFDGSNILHIFHFSTTMLNLTLA